MFCKYCGTHISYTDKWCGKCGREAAPLYMYRKSVQRTVVQKDAVNSANSSLRYEKGEDSGTAPVGDLQSFMDNTVAVNTAKSGLYDSGAAPVSGTAKFDGDVTQVSSTARFDGDATQVSSTAKFDGDATQVSSTAKFDGDATQVSSTAKFDGDVTQVSGSAYQGTAGDMNSSGKDAERIEKIIDEYGSSQSSGGFGYSYAVPVSENTPNAAASFNQSGDLVGYPEEEPSKRKRKIRKKPRKKVHVIAGIASGFLIAGIVGFGLGRILPGTTQSGVHADLVESGGQIAASSTGDAYDHGEQEETSGAGMETPVPAASVPTDSAQGTSEPGQPNTAVPGGTVHHDTCSVVSEAIADTDSMENADPGTAENIPEKEVHGPNIEGDIYVDTEDGAAM